ncbi:MAG: hypothetical protein SGILL_010421, partial [Bacillariaceae sp.]
MSMKVIRLKDRCMEDLITPIVVPRHYDLGQCKATIRSLLEVLNEYSTLTELFENALDDESSRKATDLKDQCMAKVIETIVHKICLYEFDHMHIERQVSARVLKALHQFIDETVEGKLPDDADVSDILRG